MNPNLFMFTTFFRGLLFLCLVTYFSGSLVAWFDGKYLWFVYYSTDREAKQWSKWPTLVRLWLGQHTMQPFCFTRSFHNLFIFNMEFEGGRSFFFGGVGGGSCGRADQFMIVWCSLFRIWQSLSSPWSRSRNSRSRLNKFFSSLCNYLYVAHNPSVLTD